MTTIKTMSYEGKSKKRHDMENHDVHPGRRRQMLGKVSEKVSSHTLVVTEWSCVVHCSSIANINGLTLSGTHSHPMYRYRRLVIWHWPPAKGGRHKSTLVLLRHGQSVWNKRPTFSGWCDVELTPRGRREAREAGELLRRRGYSQVDAAFTSRLSRAWESCQIVLEVLNSNATMVQDRRLNERHYGALQGLPKDSAELIAQYGEAQVIEWRRSLRSRPPPIAQDNPYYDPTAPTTESLADCRERAVECFEQVVAPALFASGDTIVLLVAHSNTLRALISHFDEVSDDDIPSLHVPNSVPIVYNFDASSRSLINSKLTTTSDHCGSHARWLLSEENHAKISKALKPGGLLARALFEAWDMDESYTLDHKEIQRGLQSVSDDVALSAIARRIVRRIHFCQDGTCTRAEFDQRAAEVAAELNQQLDEATPAGK